MSEIKLTGNEKTSVHALTWKFPDFLSYLTRLFLSNCVAAEWIRSALRCEKTNMYSNSFACNLLGFLENRKIKRITTVYNTPCTWWRDVFVTVTTCTLSKIPVQEGDPFQSHHALYHKVKGFSTSGYKGRYNLKI